MKSYVCKNREEGLMWYADISRSKECPCGKEGEMDKIPQNVIENINRYFLEKLPNYEVVKVCPKSCYEEDSYLYMVAAKKNTGSYAVWTSWNEHTQSLNYGHYDLADLESCERVMDEFYTGKT